MDKPHDLIRRLDAARAKMRAVLADLSDDAAIYPGWTIKQVVDHITGWDDAVADALRAHAGGRQPRTPAVEGIDFYNEKSVATRQPLTYAQSLSEWELAREGLKMALLELPPEKFDEPLLYPWSRTGTVAQVIEILFEHEEEHAEEVRRLTVA